MLALHLMTAFLQSIDQKRILAVGSTLQSRPASFVDCMRTQKKNVWGRSKDFCDLGRAMKWITMAVHTARLCEVAEDSLIQFVSRG
ncbi:MAG: hypothetical protein M3Q07_18520, partial [Pseudobdellovibrionaceae bacterium]|nr:hypothetical protein [Pseudobdellovibrionaceae bacterium]